MELLEAIKTCGVKLVIEPHIVPEQVLEVRDFETDEVIKTEVIPEHQEGVTGNWQEIADKLNEDGEVGGPVPYSVLRQHLLVSGIWTKLLACSKMPVQTLEQAGISATADTIIDMVQPGTFESFDFHEPEMVARAQAMCAPLIQAGFLEQDDLDGVLGLADGRGWRFGHKLTDHDISSACYSDDGELLI